MNLILDTNIFVRDFLMCSRPFSLLFDYLEKTGSRIIMPLIVYQELEGIYCAQLEERVKEYEKAKGVLERTLTDTHLPSLTIDIPHEVEQYLKFVKEQLGIDDNNVLPGRALVPFKEHYLDELVARAIARQKPFSEKGEEFRDALLWLTVLDIVRELKEETLAFISSDGRAFGRDNKLHDILRKEAETTGRQINFYNSINAFIASHATQIEYINPSWLFNVISFSTYSDYVIELLKEYIRKMNERDLRSRGWEELEFAGYLCALEPVTEESLTEYYIYEKADGSLYVQANLYFECEVEFTASIRVKQDTYSLHSYYDYDDEYTIEKKTVYKYPEAEIIFDLTIKDKQVVDIELSSWYLS